jgi:YHS domain-containing protein
MLKFIIFIAAGFFLYKLIMGDKKKKMVQKRKEEEKLEHSGEMVKDPVCGTYVSIESDIRVKDGDQVYYFCSYECRDAFLRQRYEQRDS